MKIVLWVGNEPNQKALANKINAVFPVAGIVTESRQHKRQITVPKLFEKVVEKVFMPSIGHAWRNMQGHYNNLYPDYPATRIDVQNINSEEAYNFTSELNPDLIIVSGTRLVKEKMLSIKPRIGILNLHTGISPYIKGGPNCTNWCIATRQFHLIGNTVMWIDAGIDTGNIIATDFTPFTGDEDLAEVHLKVMEHAHALYIKAIKMFAEGGSSNVKQSELGEGVTYYTRQWKLNEKIKLARNMQSFRRAVKSGEVESMQQSVRVVRI